MRGEKAAEAAEATVTAEGGEAAEAARFFQALGDETRLALLDELREGERSVGDLVEALGCPQPKVSRHLKVLKDAGLVRDRKVGRHVRYAREVPAGWSEGVRGWLGRLAIGAGRSEEPAGSSERPAVPEHRPARPAPGKTPGTPKTAASVRRGHDLETHLL
jgi:DNA-binding transcriptional ArsR family regulator